MGRDLSSDDTRELLGAYALGALEPDERARVEALLLVDQDARAELHALQFGAAWLARSDIRPSGEVWERIRAEVDADLVDSHPSKDFSPPVLLASRRRVRQLVAVAAVVAVGVIGTATILNNGSGGASVEAAARAAMDDPGTRRVDLRTPDGKVAARLVVYSDGRGYVVDTKLTPIGDRRTYQLWAITPSGAVSQGVLGRSPGASEMHGSTGERASSYAITIEHQGGSRTPKGPFVATSQFAKA